MIHDDLDDGRHPEFVIGVGSFGSLVTDAR